MLKYCSFNKEVITSSFQLERDVLVETMIVHLAIRNYFSTFEKMWIFKN